MTGPLDKCSNNKTYSLGTGVSCNDAVSKGI